MNVKNHFSGFEKNIQITTDIKDSQLNFDYTKNISPFAISDTSLMERVKTGKLDNMTNQYHHLKTNKQKFLFTSRKDEYCKMVYKNTELYCHCKLVIDKLTELWVLNGIPQKVPKKILNLSYKTYYELFNNWHDSSYHLIDVPSWILQNYQKYNTKKKKACKKRLKKYKDELLQTTWHPDRVLHWVEPCAMKRWN